MRLKHFVLFTLLFVSLVLLVACPKENALQNAAKASEAASVAVKTFQQEEITLYNQGLVTQADHLVVQDALIEIAKIGKTVDERLRQAATVNDAKSALDAAITGLNEVQTRLLPQITDRDLRIKLAIALVGVRSSLLSISAMIQ